jgi:hypothetical protein
VWWWCGLCSPRSVVYRVGVACAAPPHPATPPARARRRKELHILRARAAALASLARSEDFGAPFFFRLMLLACVCVMAGVTDLFIRLQIVQLFGSPFSTLFSGRHKKIGCRMVK